MMIARERSTLWVIDVQGRLLNQEHDWQRMLDACLWLVEVAKRLGVPVIASEQYPKGLGPTQSDLLAALQQAPATIPVGKQDFSCIAAGCFSGDSAAQRPQAVLCGMEAHVCVLQTALDLVASGREVYVVAEAVTSRSPTDVALAIERMRAAGVRVVSREMVAFEWLRTAAAPEFRSFSVDFLQ